MSFSVLTFNLINDLQLVFNFGGARKKQAPSIGEFARAFVAVMLLVCLILVVIGFGMAGAASAFENPAPVFDSIYGSLVGIGIGMAIPLGFAYFLMGGGRGPE